MHKKSIVYFDFFLKILHLHKKDVIISFIRRLIMKFYEKINIQLKEKKITRKQLCEGIGVSYNTITSMFTRQSKSITLDVIEAIAEFLNVSADYLVRDDIDDPAYGLNISESQAPLSKTEQILLKSFNELNSEGQKNLLDHAELLVASKRFLKDSTSEEFVEFSQELA